MPLEFILAISQMSNDALDRAEANLAASLEILKGLGGENAENT
jgi:hypothetical protein